MKTILFSILPLMLFLSSALFAQNILLKDGSVYSNIKILNENGDSIAIKFNNIDGKIAKVNILRIDRSKTYDPSTYSWIQPAPIKEEVRIIPPVKIDNSNQKKVMPNLSLLLVSVLSAAITYDSFAESSSLQSSIDNFNKLHLPVDQLQSEQSRKTIMGIVAGVVCIAATIISLKSVEVSSQGDKLSFAYRF